MLTLSPDDLAAVKLSLHVAAAATLLSLPAGFAAAYVLAMTKLRGKALLAPMAGVGDSAFRTVCA